MAKDSEWCLGTSPTLSDYDKGFDEFTNGNAYNPLWGKRMQEGWRSAFRKEVAFGEALAAGGKDVSGSIARLANAGVKLAA